MKEVTSWLSVVLIVAVLVGVLYVVVKGALAGRVFAVVPVEEMDAAHSVMAQVFLSRTRQWITEREVISWSSAVFPAVEPVDVLVVVVALA